MWLPCSLQGIRNNPSDLYEFYPLAVCAMVQNLAEKRTGRMLDVYMRDVTWLAIWLVPEIMGGMWMVVFRSAQWSYFTSYLWNADVFTQRTYIDGRKIPYYRVDGPVIWKSHFPFLAELPIWAGLEILRVRTICMKLVMI